MALKTDDLRIIEMQELSTPDEVRGELPVTESDAKNILSSRKTIENILDEKDDRIFVVVGPCSIHDPIAAMDYANRLKKISDKVSSNLFIVMRVYFEKPRTTIGWKGLINDPMLDGSFKINEGIRIGRKLLLDIVNLGLPTGTEYLDLISPQYIADIISWGAIGARTTESQCHRELASGLSCPIGFKNGTDGNLQITFDAISYFPIHIPSKKEQERISAFIDSNGVVVSQLESTKKGVIEVTKFKKFNETLFSKFGNKIFFCIIIIYIGMIFFVKRREHK